LPGSSAIAAGDAWLGVYKSLDGGASWSSTLLPGFPQDASADGKNSPLKKFATASDPTVRAGTNGLFHLSGIAFDRSSPSLGAIFLARYIDNNNSEGSDPIRLWNSIAVHARFKPGLLEKQGGMFQCVNRNS